MMEHENPRTFPDFSSQLLENDNEKRYPDKDYSGIEPCCF